MPPTRNIVMYCSSTANSNIARRFSCVVFITSVAERAAIPATESERSTRCVIMKSFCSVVSWPPVSLMERSMISRAVASSSSAERRSGAVDQRFMSWSFVHFESGFWLKRALRGFLISTRPPSGCSAASTSVTSSVLATALLAPPPAATRSVEVLGSSEPLPPSASFACAAASCAFSSASSRSCASLRRMNVAALWVLYAIF
mmetsp:Transcript_26633/g.82379  ORF Transcript_26633/g.82379 Transcript_26633/m.82379 type:complete len:202 (-) Transcript_26633:719-1324(-)